MTGHTGESSEIGHTGRQRGGGGNPKNYYEKKVSYMKKYDYLIVGAGLFGAVFAHMKDITYEQCEHLARSMADRLKKDRE